MADIVNTTTDMEYHKVGTTAWTDCQNGEVTGLSSGDYEVRYKETKSYNASKAVTYTVPIWEPAHTHTYGAWSKDDTNHWHECTGASCTDRAGSVKDKASHVYSDAADTTCNVCGYVRTVAPPTPPNTVHTRVTVHSVDTRVTVRPISTSCTGGTGYSECNCFQH